jgi:hypothetical protein
MKKIIVKRKAYSTIVKVALILRENFRLVSVRRLKYESFNFTVFCARTSSEIKI